jgi:hippurate hydrolase
MKGFFDLAGQLGGCGMSSITNNIQEFMVTIRRDLHRHPELSGMEQRTADKVCDTLEQLGISYRRNIGGHGIIAEIPGRYEQPYIALRADMDALPIQEETGLPFSSETAGIMHACAHDGHTAMLLGTAMLLTRQPPLTLPVRLIFQPAEETTQGAIAMIEAGALDEVALIFGGHLDRHYPAGSIVVNDGPVNASSDKFRIEIAGQGGHAARPHEAIDAVVVGSLLVMAIQTIVSREVNPAHPSVVSIGRFDAGTASNVIAGHALLEGSIRAQERSVREHLQRSIRRIAESVGQLHNARITVEILEGTPPVINPPDMASLARQAAVSTVGKEQVLQLATANMGGEDFSYYLEEVSGCYVRIGGQIPGKEGFPAHSSRFDFDEAALSAGAAYFATLAHLAGEWVCHHTL